MPQKLTKTQMQNTLSAAIKDAVAFIESEIAPERLKAQRYFEGETDLGVEDGRSSVVATKCRDTVRALKPALMRIFLQSGRPVEFAPRNPKSAPGADQATKYAQVIFERNDGFSALMDVIHDALVKKVGIIKSYYDTSPTVEIDNYTGLSDDQFALIAQDEELEIIDHEEEPTDQPVIDPATGQPMLDPMGLPVMAVLHNATVARTMEKGEICFESVAPEDFFVDRAAKDITRAYVCGHSTEGRVGDLVEMGFDFDEVLEYAGAKSGSSTDEEQLERTGWDQSEDDEGDDPSMRKVVITEAYMKMDIEGTGIPRLYKFICAGNDYEILDYSLCDYQPFAVFEVDPEPHTFFGRSIVDIITDDQDASTLLLRGLLDSILWLNNPRVEIVENQVNIDDVLNNEFGGIIRTKAPGMMREVPLGTAATAAMPAMQYYDDIIKQKTGVVGGGMGLDTEALSSQTAAGVRMADQVTNAVAELIARTLAEGGMKQLFRTIAQLARQHPNPGEMIRVDGQFIPVDPRSWATDMDLVCNVGIGTGRHEERLQTLAQTLQYQVQAWQMGGPSNGLVGLTEMRNALVDLMALGGVANGDRYWKPMNPQIEQQMQQAAAQAAQSQKASDPNAAYLQVEGAKVQQKAQADQARIQIDAQKAQADAALKMQQLKMQDDLARDKMLQDLAIEVAKILGQSGVRVNTAAVQQAQAAPRL